MRPYMWVKSKALVRVLGTKGKRQPSGLFAVGESDPQVGCETSNGRGSGQCDD